jgi:hypothetical protein
VHLVGFIIRKYRTLYISGVHMHFINSGGELLVCP